MTMKLTITLEEQEVVDILAGLTAARAIVEQQNAPTGDAKLDADNAAAVQATLARFSALENRLSSAEWMDA